VRWSTHVTLGAGFAGAAVIAAVSSGFATPDPITIGAVLLGATFGSLLPDLDARESKIKYLKVGRYRPFHLISDFLNGKFGHR